MTVPDLETVVVDLNAATEGKLALQTQEWA